MNESPEVEALRELSEQFGRVTPEAAMKNLEQSLRQKKEDEERSVQEAVEAAVFRKKQLATPVVVYLDGEDLELPRLLYEEIEDRRYTWNCAGFDFEDGIADILKPLLREGLIKLVERES